MKYKIIIEDDCHFRHKLEAETDSNADLYLYLQHLINRKFKILSVVIDK